MTEQAGRPQDGQKDQAARAGSGSDRTGSARAGSGRSASGRASSGRSATGASGADVFSDFQRWLIRSSARNMRKEIGGQVRKTFSGGRSESMDVWDVATTEIPAEVGESPECQWCPICRAARQFRDSGPGIGGHLSGAGNAVASAVQDAINTLDSVLSKAAGTADRDRQDRDWQERHRTEGTRPDWQSGSGPGSGTAAATSQTAERTGSPIAVTPTQIVVPGADSPETAETAGRAGPSSAGVIAGPAETTGGPAETTVLGSPASEPDAWSLVTDRADGGMDAPDADLTAGHTEDDGGHGPDDRG